MFKKLTALFLLTAFTHVYAVEPIQQSQAIRDELNRSFDELNYKLNVEWDQKDTKAFDKAVKEFEKEISDLQAQGMTNKDLVNHALDKIKDAQIQKDLGDLQNIIKENKMTDAEARAFVIQKLSSTYSHGASWSGSRLGVHCGLIMAAIIIILVVCHNRDKEDTTTVEEPCEPTPPQCTPCTWEPRDDFTTPSQECCPV